MRVLSLAPRPDCAWTTPIPRASARSPRFRCAMATQTVGTRCKARSFTCPARTAWSTKSPYLEKLWTDNDGAAGGPIIADGLVWTIGGNTVHGLNPANGDEVVSIPLGGMRTTSRRRRRAMAYCSFPVPTRSSPSWVRPGCRRHPLTNDNGSAGSGRIGRGLPTMT
jgi:hypothetical protein